MMNKSDLIINISIITFLNYLINICQHRVKMVGFNGAIYAIFFLFLRAWIIFCSKKQYIIFINGKNEESVCKMP